MKRTIILAIAMLVCGAMHAQQLVGILNHNDTITAYYGPNALQQAVAAAVNGDIITLSPGTFNATNINKVITIRGAGMCPDSVTGTNPTIIQGGFNIDVATDSTYTLIMEGLRFPASISYDHANLPQFIKCHFYRLAANGTSDCNLHSMDGASFINCVIESFNSDYYYYGGIYCSYCVQARNTQFINSIILDLDNRHNPSLINCVAKVQPSNDVSIVNSIVFYNDIPSNVNAEASYNSIGVYTGDGDANYFNYTNVGDHNLTNLNSLGAVFVNFDGTYNQGSDLHLLDSIAASHLGSDGTQIGIYGGPAPFNPYMRIPHIGRISVSTESDENGQLPVDIEIISE